jgi:hypothetical protein
MERYRNLDGDAGVAAYEIGRDYIRVRFVEGAVYRYTVASAGLQAIEEMKALARAGKGLTTFISRHVHDAYESRED